MAGPTDTHARTLASILLEAAVVTQDQIDAGLLKQRRTGLRIGETLVEMGVATEEDIGWALARQLDLPFVDVSPEALDQELIRSFPEGLLHRLDAVPLLNEEPALSVAVADPTDSELILELERAAGRPLKLAVATASAIRRVLRDVLGQRREPYVAIPMLTADGHFDVQWDRSGASFLLFYLSDARRAGASELHFLARAEALDVQHRVGGRLHKVASESPGAIYYLLARIEALGGPVLDDSRTHAAGRVTCVVGAETLDLGISLLRCEQGLAVAFELRVIPARPATLGELGLEPVDLARLRGALAEPFGLGIVCGPPGSGGSTTLSALLAEIGKSERRSLAFGMTPPLGSEDVHVPAASADLARIWPEVAVAQCADIVALDGVLAGPALAGALSAEAAGRLLLVRTDWTDSFAMLDELGARAANRAALAARLRFVIQQRLPRVRGEAPPGSACAHPPGRRGVFEVLFVEEPLRGALRAGAGATALRACAEADGIRLLGAGLAAVVALGVVSAAEAARNLA